MCYNLIGDLFMKKYKYQRLTKEEKKQAKNEFYQTGQGIDLKKRFYHWEQREKTNIMLRAKDFTTKDTKYTEKD